MNPLDEYLSTKTAAVRPPMPGLGKFMSAPNVTNLQAGAVQALGGMAVMGIAGAAQKAMQSIKKKRHYDEMMDANPDLQLAMDKDPKQFNVLYNSFRRLNPEFASDPVLSGTYMRKMTEYPEGAGHTIVESLQGRRHMGGPSFGYSGGTGGFKASVDF